MSVLTVIGVQLQTDLEYTLSKLPVNSLFYLR